MRLLFFDVSVVRGSTGAGLAVEILMQIAELRIGEFAN
jgi:hypothetical protein